MLNFWQRLGLAALLVLCATIGLTGFQQTPGGAGQSNYPVLASANTFTGVNNFTGGINANTLGATTPGTIAATTIAASGQITSTQATGSAPLVIASTTTVPNLTVSNHPTVEYCGTTSTCAKTQKTTGFVIFGSVAFPTASTVTVTSLPFSTSTSYACTASDFTTAAGVVNATTYTSGASITFTETNGVNTDTMFYVCAGN